MSAEPDRRQFLMVALSGVSAIAFGSGCETADPSQPDDNGKASELPQTRISLNSILNGYFAFAVAADVRAVGDIYNERFADRRALADDLGIAVTLAAQSETVDAAVGLLTSAVKSDFGSGRTVALSGWQLAVTEARLCGLIAFLAAAS